MPIIAAVLGMLLLLILGKLLSFPIRVITKLLLNGLAGAVLLFVVNLIGGIWNLNVEITALNALIAGFFGLPGVVLLLLLKV